MLDIYHQTPSRNLSGIMSSGLIPGSALIMSEGVNTSYYKEPVTFLSIGRPYIYASDYFDDEEDVLVDLRISIPDTCARIADVPSFIEETCGRYCHDSKSVIWDDMDEVPADLFTFMRDGNSIPVARFLDSSTPECAIAILKTSSFVIRDVIPPHDIQLPAEFKNHNDMQISSR